jgi:hypothetical protein
MSQGWSAWHAACQSFFFSSFIGSRIGTGTPSPGSFADTTSSFAMGHSQLRSDGSETR